MIHQTSTSNSVRQRATGTLRSLIAVLWVLGLYIFMCLPAGADECSFPDNVNWIVDQSCEISAIQIAPRSLSVIDGAVLTVQNSGELILDMRNFRITVDSDSRIAVDPEGRIRSNQIGPRIVRQTDGGSFGYFLKQVDGPVIDSFNSNLNFHPSSTIKVLYMLEALRGVDAIANPFSLGATQLNLCPSVVVGAIGGTTCLISSFTTSDGTTGAGGVGGNCIAPNAVANTNTNCSGAMVTRNLGTSICAMMKVSNNQTANAIQELVGNGNPTTGWNNMITNAGQAVGLTATTLANRMGCGGPNNNPNNLTTLRDLGRIFEGMANDPVVLTPNNPPASLVFTNTQAYRFMDNDGNVNGDALIAPLNAIIAEQANELGLAAAPTAFTNAVRFVHKRGSNITKDMNGDGGIDLDTDGDGIADAIDPRDFRTIAGWLSLPMNGGTATRDYVFGLFYNDIDPSSIIGTLVDDAPEMFRPILRAALEDF